MKLTSVTFALATLSAGAGVAASRIEVETSQSPKTKGYIVELESGSNLQGGVDAQDDFRRQANSVLRDYSVTREFKNSKYFYGIAIDTPDDDEDVLATISNLPNVKNVWPNRVLPRPAPIGVKPVESDASIKVTSAEEVTVVHVTGDSDVLSSLKMTGIDELHRMNITGQGVKVAIIDSGVDYRHPALGGAFGPGNKIIGGYDLVGDAYDGLNERVPDEDPLVTCLDGAHGTHVAGIIGAQDPENVGYGIVGVAPDAELMSFRVFGCAGSTQDDGKVTDYRAVLIEALQMAGEAEADVINISIGQDIYWEAGDVYASLFQNLLDQGTSVVVSAGNSGGGGLFWASEPALSPHAIAVGSVSNTKLVTTYHGAASNGDIVDYASLLPINDTESSFHLFSITADDGSCTEEQWLNATSEFPDKELVILVNHANSRCYPSLLRELAAATGINKIFQVAYTDLDLSIAPPGSELAEYQEFQISEATAQLIEDGLSAQGIKYTLAFEDSEVHDSAQITHGTMDAFSSYGPTMEMSLKPQFSAPGGNILSTWVTTGGVGYAVVSGTSMAAPYSAGVYALIKQKYPDLSPSDIRRRMQTTSTPLMHLKDDVLSTAAKQGSGLLNALGAVNSSTKLQPSEINLRDSSTPLTRNITIENESDQTQVYTLGHSGAASMETWPDLYDQKASNPFRFREVNIEQFADVSFDSTTVEVPASSSKTVEFTITPPSGLDTAKMPVYGGYITVDSETEGLVVPYLGVPYQRSEVSILEVPDKVNYYVSDPQPPAGVPRFPYVQSSGTSTRNNGMASYTFSNGTDLDAPRFEVIGMQATDYMRFDVVPVDTDFEADMLGFDPDVHHNTTKPNIDISVLDNFLDVPSYGSIMIVVGGYDKPQTPYQYRTRGIGFLGGMWPEAKVALDNGTIHELPDADYRILIRALKSGYDLNNAEGYESWLSPVLRIKTSTA